MNSNFKNLLLLLIFIIAGSCSKDDNGTIVKSDAKELQTFIFTKADNLNLEEDVTGTISTSDHTIMARFAHGTDVTALTPSITLSELATVSPKGAQDFSSPVSYTLTAEDGSTQEYVCSVLVDKNNAKELLTFAFTKADNLNLEEDITGTISTSDHTIMTRFAHGTDVTALTPSIALSELATVSPSGTQDFSSPITYTVTAEDGSTQEYICTALVNRAPEAFSLVAPVTGATEVDRLLSFGWEASTDPEGGTVSYNFYLGTEETSTTLFAENLSITSFTLTERLRAKQIYYWRVEAVDEEGVSTSSAIHAFNTREVDFSALAITDNAEFSKRWGHTTVVYNDKLWVIGGDDGDGKNDVWSSSNGISWDEVASNAAFSGRWRHTSVVFNNKLWVIGGYDGTRKNDVWSSSDGITWTEATSNAPFTGRYGHTTVVYKDKLWVIGGDDTSKKNDVWSSSDGITWTEVTSNAPFTGRFGHTTIVYNDKLWVIGGRDGSYKNDVWSSSDGVNWTEVTSNAPFAERYYHSAVAYDGKLWVMGGSNANPRNDVWYSLDGITWTNVTDDAEFSQRNLHTTVVYNGQVWVIGGVQIRDLKNDVWAFD
ncbi:Kelch repeat-containing protein [Flavivirga algicola]|uniref:Fibronectin type-III domain-containing protein n=1 Tax=Flavivirga algicola TaxID=2729136 RepID=A0ABX1S235_9FLAO|nr:hypothetical protein [Flavivirga algicola]NMH89924.1 hypothetical protein [Flavivirga algicola]